MKHPLVGKKFRELTAKKRLVVKMGGKFRVCSRCGRVRYSSDGHGRLRWICLSCLEASRG